MAGEVCALAHNESGICRLLGPLLSLTGEAEVTTAMV